MMGSLFAVHDCQLSPLCYLCPERVWPATILSALWYQASLVIPGMVTVGKHQCRAAGGWRACQAGPSPKLWGQPERSSTPYSLLPPHLGFGCTLVSQESHPGPCWADCMAWESLGCSPCLPGCCTSQTRNLSFFTQQLNQGKKIFQATF